MAASQEIYRAVRELQKKKKVIVSMGSVAASGGYLIATAADRIVANPGTITGSISAVMHFADVQELMKKVGVRSSVIKSGKFKDIGSPVREMTAEEKQLIQGIVDDIYDQFVRTIAENRKIPLEIIMSLADGRIFSGRQALQLKLVDELGGLQDAVLLAGRLAGIEGKPAVVYCCKEKIQLMEVSHREYGICRSREKYGKAPWNPEERSISSNSRQALKEKVQPFIMTYRTILVEKKEGYSIVTMHRPGEMNALSYEMRCELQDCFTQSGG